MAVAPFAGSSLHRPWVFSSTRLKVNGEEFGSPSWSTAVTLRTPSPEQLYSTSLASDGQLSLESSTCSAIVPVAIPPGDSEMVTIPQQDVSSMLNKSKPTKRLLLGAHRGPGR